MADRFSAVCIYILSVITLAGVVCVLEKITRERVWPSLKARNAGYLQQGDIHTSSSYQIYQIVKPYQVVLYGELAGVKPYQVS